jgi:hypothetical protein
MRLSYARRGGLLAVVAAAALLAGVVPAAAAPGDGSAYGASVNVTLLGSPAVTLAPVSASNTNGPTHNTLVSVNLPGILTTKVITTSAVRDSSTGAVKSTASTAKVGIPLLSAFGKVGASLVTATCEAVQSGETGSTSLAGLSLGSTGTVGVNPAANTTLMVALPIVGNVATIIFNEQIHNPDGSLTVNAIHIHLLGSGLLGTLGSGDVIISSATCGPAVLPIPMASGMGMWIGFALLGAIAVSITVVLIRRRRVNSV